LHRILQLLDVDGPPFPRGTTWSISSRTVEPHTPPPTSGHWHFPSSRFSTSRFTFAGTEAFRFACFSMSSSSAAVSTCSSVDLGWTWDCPALAFFSKAMKVGLTVTCIRVSCWVSGSTTVLRTSGRGLAPSGWVRSSSTGWTKTGAGSTGARSGPTVTTVLLGTTSAGSNSAATCFASCFERWKNRGITSARFSGVITLASWGTFETQSRPSRSGSAISGNSPTNRAATWR
jgi:hypothetical protein